jgi:hypothetical protein
MELSFVGSAGASDHLLYLLSCNTWEEWPTKLELASPHFTLFLACDARGLDGAALTSAGSRILRQGLVYLCAWGPECERVHDAFDEAIVDKRSSSSGQEDVILTTWHAGEPLEKALTFFLDTAEPASAFRYSCTSWVAASIGSAEWASKIKSRLLLSLNRELGGGAM